MDCILYMQGWHRHAIYANKKKISQNPKTANLQAVITPYRSSSSVFMMNNKSSGDKKHRKSTEPESWQTAKINVFLFSSDELVQIYVTISRWFSHKTAAFFTEQCTSPSLFSRIEVSQGDLNRSLKNYDFHYDAIFFPHMYTCAQITQQQNVIST